MDSSPFSRFLRLDILLDPIVKFFNGVILMSNLIVCSVVTELQAAQVAKICQDHGIQSVIKMKPFVEISN